VNLRDVSLQSLTGITQDRGQAAFGKLQLPKKIFLKLPGSENPSKCCEEERSATAHNFPQASERFDWIVCKKHR
jgi:hypothetical protein